MRAKFLYAFIFICSIFYSQKKDIYLSSNWFFKQKSASAWNSAAVPGNVFTDLYQSKLIPNPFYSDNEQQLQWIENEDWEYKTEFDCDKTISQNTFVELCFEGLDTYASVYLNDSLILNANNMFRSWKVDVKRLLKHKKNLLHIVFESAVNKGKQEAVKLSYVLPEGERVFSRKAQFQYGWDFGPRFAACGIWKPIVLSAWSDVQIKKLNYDVLLQTDSIAVIQFVVKTESEKEHDYKLLLDGKFENERPLINQSKKIHLKKGSNCDTIKATIRNPKLWWSNGLGAANLYQFNCSITDEKGVKTQQSLNVGIRKIEWVFKPDSIGNTFYFKLNGVPVFMKGANYIPSDIFLGQKNKQAYKQELATYKEVHMNMLRIWGGGVYGSDEFFNACDEQGILVWQDFMFACAMYPGDTDFMNNTKEEIIEQVTRLQNHPSLALWCGNNESDEGWKNWGWQKQFKYSRKDSAKIGDDYTKLFHSIIPEIIKNNSPKIPYLSSSPLIGWGHKESLTHSDSHYWGIWWGMEPFSNYEKKVGRFMTEYGFQSMPDLATFKTFCSSAELNLNSTAVRAHQKHKTGYETIQKYLERDYKTPANFIDYIYVSQLLQRDGMRTAIESHRRSKPSCMGTLFWQLNDCWPGTSWSAIDYYARPKAFYYSLKQLYNTVLLSVKKESDGIDCVIISDSLKELNAHLQLQLLDFHGKLLWKMETKIKVSSIKNSHYLIAAKELPSFDSTRTYLKTELYSDNKYIASNFYFFTKAKNIMYPKAIIAIRKTDENNFEISSNVFAKDIFVYDEVNSPLFDLNYFDLEAGEKKIIKRTDKVELTKPLNLKVIVLNNL